jgi:dolichol-phosphate mannosyltransferase
MDLSVVSPFYNEEALIQKNIRKMLAKLKTLELEWELIVVNDGSTDKGLEQALEVARTEPKLKLLSYTKNKGRGHALRTGIAAATGAVIVTTEADLSWGEDVVTDLYAAMQKWPEADLVVASPNMEGGAYRNIPWKRVLLSKLGNTIIRTFMLDVVTMNTGMTRAYRRDVIQSLPLFENSKEFHVEVILKAVALGLNIKEIPAILEWPAERHTEGGGEKKKKKKTSFFASNLFQFVISHSLMSIMGNPTRYIWTLSFMAFVVSMVLLVISVVAKLLGGIAAYTALLSASMFILSVMLFVFGVSLRQSSNLLKEIWIMQRQQNLSVIRPKDTVYQVQAPRVGAPAALAEPKPEKETVSS